MAGKWEKKEEYQKILSEYVADADSRNYITVRVRERPNARAPRGKRSDAEYEDFRLPGVPHDKLKSWEKAMAVAQPHHLMSGEQWLYSTFSTRTIHGKEGYVQEPNLNRISAEFSAKSYFLGNRESWIHLRNPEAIAKAKALAANLAPSSEEILKRNLSMSVPRVSASKLTAHERTLRGKPRINLNKSAWSHIEHGYSEPTYEVARGFEKYDRPLVGLPNETEYYQRAFGQLEVLDFGGSRKGFGSTSAHRVKRAIRRSFKGMLQNVSELGKRLTGVMHATARLQRDMLLDALQNGCDVRDGGSPDYHSYVSAASAYSLQDLKAMKHPYGRKGKSTITPDSIPYVFAKQMSDGTGYSGRGSKSIWSTLEPVDNNDRKVYGIKWGDAQSAYIYNNFLVPGTSKMVGRPSFAKSLIGVDLLANYMETVTREVTKVIVEYKKPGK